MRSGVRIPHGAPEHKSLPHREGFLIRRRHGGANPAFNNPAITRATPSSPHLLFRFTLTLVCKAQHGEVIKLFCIPHKGVDARAHVGKHLFGSRIGILIERLLPIVPLEIQRRHVFDGRQQTRAQQAVNARLQCLLVCASNPH